METASHNPEIVLLDLGLPDLDGVEVIKRIRTWSNLPIIVISARSEDTDKIDALDAGADDYLIKPFDPATLLSTVKGKVTRARSLQSQSEARYESYRKKVVHTLSHEFRTPLVAINTGTELLLDQKDRLDSGKIQNLLEAIRRGGLRLERLVNDFMLLQQIEAGLAQNLFKTRATKKSLKDLMHQFHSNMGEELETQGVSLTLTENCDDAAVLVYEPQIIDILQRLVNNAVKFSSQEKSLEIHLCPCGDEISIEIRDRGLACAVVMLTAHSEKERIIQALQLGAIDYVTKPFEVAVLLEKIPVWLAMGQRLQDIANHSESTGADLQKQLRLIELFQAEANKTDSD